MTSLVTTILKRTLIAALLISTLHAFAATPGIGGFETGTVPANPGFEAGTLAGWTPEQTSPIWQFSVDATAHSGAWAGLVQTLAGASISPGTYPYADLRNAAVIPGQSGDVFFISYWMKLSTTNLPAGISAVGSAFIDVTYSDGSSQRLFPLSNATPNAGYQLFQAGFTIPSVAGKTAQSFTVAPFLEVNNPGSQSVTFSQALSASLDTDDLIVSKQLSVSDISGLSSTLNQINTTVSSLSATVSNLNSRLQTYGEKPTGIMNGSNANFTLQLTPQPASSVAVYRNGIRQSLTADYTVSGAIITFVGNSLPQSGDIVLVDYTHN